MLQSFEIMENKLENGGITDAQIQEWKKAGKVFEVSVPSEEEDGTVVTGYFRKPKREAIEYVAKMANEPVMATKYLMKHCFLGGDSRLMGEKDEDYCYYQSACVVVNDLLAVKQASVKKL